MDVVSSLRTFIHRVVQLKRMTVLLEVKAVRKVRYVCFLHHIQQYLDSFNTKTGPNKRGMDMLTIYLHMGMFYPLRCLLVYEAVQLTLVLRCI